MCAAALLIVPTADAAEQWNDGVYQSTTYTQCVVHTTEVGADAWTGYRADPSNPPRAGDVFYGHVEFGAATSACGGDQMAEVDLVLPPGVSLAIDGDHPIQCAYYDPNQDPVANPTCPTHTVTGTYGQMLPAGDGGAAWDMPPGRTLIVAFPLKSSRELRGPAGGTCPQTVGEISAYPQHDCLISAVHVLDGDTDPWLAPGVQMFVNPAASSSPSPTPTSGGSTTPSVVSLTVGLPKGQHLRTIAKKRSLAVTCTASATGRCKVQATIAAAQARKLHLKVAKSAKRYTLGSGSKQLSAGKSATLKLKLSKKVASALKRAHSLKLTLTASDSAGPGATTRTLTLRR